MVGAWEVGPANAAGKKNIAGKQDGVGCRIEAKASGAVARNEKYAKWHATEDHLGRFLNQKIRLNRFWLEREPCILVKIGIGHERDAVFVKSDLAMGGLLEFGSVIKVVRVSVGDYQQIESHSE